MNFDKIPSVDLSEHDDEALDFFDPSKPIFTPLCPSAKSFDRHRRGSVSAESYDPAKGSAVANPKIPKTDAERARLVAVASSNLLMRGINPETREQIVSLTFRDCINILV